MSVLELKDVAYDSVEGSELIAEVQLDLTEQYGGPDETPVDPRTFDPPDGLFLVAYVDGEPIGCAGLRRHDEETVELKRMFVRAMHRRRGHARRLLQAVEERAVALGYRRLALETGTEQPEAIALYESAGYEAYPGFGYYADEPGSRPYVKTID